MSNAVAPIKQINDATLAQVVDAIDKRTDQFLALLGTQSAVDRFRTVALHAVSSRPDLLRTDPLTIVEAIREAASLDLEPVGPLGEAYLIPYKGAARLRIGYQGWLKLIRRSGAVDAVDAQVVYLNDLFELKLGTEPNIRHEPALKDRGGYRGAYAWARLKTGDLIIEWLPVEDVDPIRKIAAADSLMWNEFPGEGMRKSAIRRLQKRLPRSAIVERALIVESSAEDMPATPPARSAAVAALADRFSPVEKVDTIQDSLHESQKVVRESEKLVQESRVILDGVLANVDEMIVEAGGTVPEDEDDLINQALTAEPAADQPIPEAATPVSDEDEPTRQARVLTEIMTPAPAEAMVQCESKSPFSDDVQCLREQGHYGPHKTRNESW